MGSFSAAFQAGVRRPARIRTVLLLLYWCAASEHAVAQTRNTVEWTGSFFAGTIWKHTPKLTIRTGQALTGQEFGIRIQLQGRKAWHAWQRFPAFGLAFAHFHLGAQAHGDAWGLLPNLSVPLFRAARLTGAFRVGTGLGYVSHPYDYFRNPGQNAIGSHWNNYTQFRLSLEYRLSGHLRMQAGIGLNHFSNGSVALPNYGVNLPGGFVALAWSPLQIRNPEFFSAVSGKRGGRSWGGQVSGGLALVEYSVFDGPRYPVWAASGAAFYQLNRVNRASFGLEYEFNRAVFEWGLRSGWFRTERAATRGATRLALALADEFLFGAIGVQLLAGLYAGTGLNQNTANTWYSKFTTRYYFPPLFHTRLQPYAGISLKAHRTTAEYISLHTGLSFHAKKQ